MIGRMGSVPILPVICPSPLAMAFWPHDDVGVACKQTSRIATAFWVYNVLLPKFFFCSIPSCDNRFQQAQRNAMNSYRQIVRFHVDSLERNLGCLVFLSLNYLRQLWIPFLNDYAFYTRGGIHRCLLRTPQIHVTHTKKVKVKGQCPKVPLQVKYS